MSCSQYSEPIFRKSTDTHDHDTSYRSSTMKIISQHRLHYESTEEITEDKPTLGQITDFAIKFSRSSAGNFCQKPLLENPILNIIRNIKQEFSFNKGRQIISPTIENIDLLLRTERALEVLNKGIKELAEGIFYDVRLLSPNRATDYVIDGWIVIPKYDRNLEYEIYRKLGDVIRSTPSLFLDFHVIASKGRELHKLISGRYKRYNPWSDYVC